jgi:hypothetical protein
MSLRTLPQAADPEHLVFPGIAAGAPLGSLEGFRGSQMGLFLYPDIKIK